MQKRCMDLQRQNKMMTYIKPTFKMSDIKQILDLVKIVEITFSYYV